MKTVWIKSEDFDHLITGEKKIFRIYFFLLLLLLIVPLALFIFISEQNLKSDSDVIFKSIILIFSLLGAYPLKEIIRIKRQIFLINLIKMKVVHAESEPDEDVKNEIYMYAMEVFKKQLGGV